MCPEVYSCLCVACAGSAIRRRRARSQPDEAEAKGYSRGRLPINPCAGLMCRPATKTLLARQDAGDAGASARAYSSFRRDLGAGKLLAGRE